MHNDNSSKSTAEEFSPIRAIMRLNQQVKVIVHNSDKVYLTALNAMFIARRVSSKTMAFSRVTTELRKFSHQMEDSMNALSQKFAVMIYKVAECFKVMRRKHKMTIALSMTKHSESIRIAELRYFYRHDEANDKATFVKMREVIIVELVRLNGLIRIGQNLVVLSKVEAMQAEGYIDVLAEISERLEDSLNDIENIVKAMKNSIAA